MVQDGSRILVQDGSRILREMGREMAPRNFDSPPRNRPRNDSAKFCTALREIFTALREICPRNFSKRLSSATLRIRNRLREISGTNFWKKFEKGAPRNRGKFGGIWWRRSLQFGGFWRRFQSIIQGTFPASELFIPWILASEDLHHACRYHSLPCPLIFLSSVPCYKSAPAILVVMSIPIPAIRSNPSSG